MGSFGGAYAAWLFDYLDGSTALGLGCLSFVLGLRMFIGRWEKGQKRWWMDWNRAGEGLERDVTVRYISREMKSYSQILPEIPYNSA